ncbi:MAG TPA: glycosyltransferase family 2 protein, partial [Chitinophagaceae bacterium]
MPSSLLSIIIINYNVKYFLEQCLYSVQKALQCIEGEIIVIDNCSADGSLEYLQPAFPGVRFIANKENAGFSKANNQGWRLAKGDYVLFLNPDTLLAEDSLRRSLDMMEAAPQAGALGIRMIDGSGHYLPESKRGNPSALVSFYKLSGLTRLFPRSEVFAHYYLGHLSLAENQEVEVLAGAYMMVRKSMLETTGGFDERFFMYGEDVDLSYRIRQLGYKNLYLADSTIIHFKGESTKKDAKYVALFYKAMELFVEKHYGKQAGWYKLLLRVAIRIRAAGSFVWNLLTGAGLKKT